MGHWIKIHPRFQNLKISHTYRCGEGRRCIQSAASTRAWFSCHQQSKFSPHDLCCISLLMDRRSNFPSVHAQRGSIELSLVKFSSLSGARSVFIVKFFSPLRVPIINVSSRSRECRILLSFIASTCPILFYFVVALCDFLGTYEAFDSILFVCRGWPSFPGEI